MKTKTILFAAFYVVFIFAAHCQSEGQSEEYQKFRLSVNAGGDFALGSSNTVLPSPIGDFILPNASLGFGTGFDGAYFFTKNYGIGIKYHFYTADEKNGVVKEEDIDGGIYQEFIFKEKTHIIGLTIHARCFLFDTKWETSANMGVMLLHNNLSEILCKTTHFPKGQTTSNYQNWHLGETFPTVGFSDFNGTSVGFTVSTSIGYRITPTLGVGLRADGFFASLSKMETESIDYFNGISRFNGINRRINRIGVSAEISVNF